MDIVAGKRYKNKETGKIVDIIEVFMDDVRFESGDDKVEYSCPKRYFELNYEELNTSLSSGGKYSTKALIEKRDKLATELFIISYKNNMMSMAEEDEMREFYEDLSIGIATSFINKLSKA